MQIHRFSRAPGASAVAVAAILVISGCTAQESPDDQGAADSADEGTGDAAGGAASLGDIQVALVPGGAHPYFQPWQDGGEAAAEDFGIGSVTFNESSEWDQTKQNAALNSLAAQGYNAFGVFGVSATDINTTFDMLNEDFAVGSLASCPAGDENLADFCLSTDTDTAAYLGAQAAIEAMGGSGNLVHLTGNAVDTNTQRRIQGVERAVEETGGEVSLLTTVTDIDTDLQSAQQAVGDLLATQGQDIDGIVTTAFNPAVAATQGVSDTGLPIEVIAIDDDPIVLDAIADGTIAGTIVQNPYGQGYVGSWALASLQSGACTVNESGFTVDSGSFLVTQENVETYDEERLAKTEELLQQFQNEFFDCG